MRLPVPIRLCLTVSERNEGSAKGKIPSFTADAALTC